MSDGEPQDRRDVDRARTRLEVTRYSDRSLGTHASAYRVSEARRGEAVVATTR
jgi:hypothetical protein